MNYFDENLEIVKNDIIIKEFFKEHNIYEFIKFYMNVDLLLRERCSNKDFENNIHCRDLLTNKIESIESILSKLYNNFTNNSSKKGAITENLLYSNLVAEIKDSEISLTSHIPHSGDIQIVKDNVPKIIIESKHFQSGNVPKLDLQKFINNCNSCNSSGILCNAFGGIANKKNFDIDILNNNNILIYITDHKFDISKFKIAISIIYSLHKKLVLNIEQNGKNISYTELENIKYQYHCFLETLKDKITVIKQSLSSIEDLSLSCLDTLLLESNPKPKKTKFKTKKV